MIQFHDVTIRAGDFRLERLTFQVPAGKYAVLMGRTGRGKTTILEAICGLRQVESGVIAIGEVDVTDWLPGDRQIGYVPQDIALFPNLTVREHLAFALRLRKSTSRDVANRIAELAEVLGIAALLDRSIDGLSGGESQRVALGRALSFRPSVLLLDEPLSALDEATRGEIQDLLKRIKETSGTTTIHVTHNQSEADTLADQLLILDNGVIKNA